MQLENRRVSSVVKIILVLSLFIMLSCDKEKLIEKKDNTPSTINKFNSKKLNTITFQTQWLHQAQFAGFYVAKQKGFYSNYGLNVQIEMGGPENPSPVALQNNKAQFVSMFLTSALREINDGHQIVNIAQISQKSSLLLVAKKSSGILKINDINGKRVGLWINDFKEPSITFLNKNRIKAEIVPISWTVNVLTNDVVDIMNMMVYNEYDVLINTGIDPKELTIFPLADNGVNIPEDGIYCRKEFYQNNKDMCHDFAEATMDGWIYALNHEEETLAIVLDYLRAAHLPANIPHQKWMLTKLREAVLAKPEQFGKLSEQDYSFSASMLIGNKVITKQVPYAEFVGYEATK